MDNETESISLFELWHLNSDNICNYSGQYTVHPELVEGSESAEPRSCFDRLSTNGHATEPEQLLLFNINTYINICVNI